MADESKGILKQLYYRCSYADFTPKADPSEFKIKNALSTRTRLLMAMMKDPAPDRSLTDFTGFDEADQQRLRATLSKLAVVQNHCKLLLTTMAAETLFYLPNHFRQTMLVNSNSINFTQST